MLNIDQILNFKSHIISESMPNKITINLPFTLVYKIVRNGNIIYVVVYPGGMDYAVSPNISTLHQHDHFELMYVLEGELTNQIENNYYQYKKGDACLLNRNIRHSEVPANNCTVVFINFSDLYIRQVLNQDIIHDAQGNEYLADGKVRQFIMSNLEGKERFSRNYMEFNSTLQALSKKEPSPMEAIIDLMQQEMLEQKPGAYFMLKGLLTRLIHTLEDPTEYHANYMQLDSSSEDFLFARITNYPKESNGCITRSELSKALNYNAEYLNQIVKKRTGSSILQLGKTYMLDKAKQMLIQTDDSIAAIIKELGFVSSSHFYKFFQKETGMSPSEYRNQKNLAAN